MLREIRDPAFLVLVAMTVCGALDVPMFVAVGGGFVALQSRTLPRFLAMRSRALREGVERLWLRGVVASALTALIAVAASYALGRVLLASM